MTQIAVMCDTSGWTTLNGIFCIFSVIFVTQTC